MQRTYRGQKANLDVFGTISTKNVFSDSSSFSTSNSSCDCELQVQVQPESSASDSSKLASRLKESRQGRAAPKSISNQIEDEHHAIWEAVSKTVLHDVSNVQQSTNSRLKSRPKQGKKGKISTNPVDLNLLPNFDSFDDYSLVVESKVAKSHGSQSSSDWTNVPTLNSYELKVMIEAIKVDSLATSSPKVCKSIRQFTPSSAQAGKNQLTASSHSCSGAVTRSMSKSLASSTQSSIGVHTRRAKRIRQITHDSSMSTSTPQQHRKMSRLQSPMTESNLSHIPLDMEDECGELVESMHHVSVHESLLEPSLCSDHLEHSKKAAESIVNDSIELSLQNHIPLVKVHDASGHTTSDLSLLSVDDHNTTYSSAPISPSIFSEESSAAITNVSSCYDKNVLVSIREEEEDSDIEHSDSIIVEHECDEPASPAVATTPFRDHRTSSSKDFSEERMNQLILEMQNLQSPSLAEMTKQRRERSLLRQCGQRGFVSWYQYLSVGEMKKLKKIGEGVYGEVFLREKAESVSVIKVVPMAGSCTVNDELQKTIVEMRNEARITKMLSDIGCNFIEVTGFVCTEGSYPKELLDNWDDYAAKKESENDRPDYFPVDQQYLIFEFVNGGEALESYNFRNAAEGLSVLLQIGWSLALAEDYYQFEHRDLHWSNILVLPTSLETQEYKFKASDHSVKIAASGVKVNIIDFTLSRLNFGEEIVYCDLSKDETLFQGEGDYQFDIYRQMRDVNGNDWQGYNPVTNVLWIRYIIDKLLKMKTFPSKRNTTPSASQFKKMLIGLYKRSEKYYSTIQMVYTDEVFQQYTLS